MGGPGHTGLGDDIGDPQLIRGGLATVGLGVLMVAIPLEPDALAVLGCLVAGLGCAPVYPAIIQSTPVNFGRRNSQAVIVTQMAAAYTGSTFAPPVFGAISSSTGMWILPLFLAVLVALEWLAGAYFAVLLMVRDQSPGALLPTIAGRSSDQPPFALHRLRCPR